MNAIQKEEAIECLMRRLSEELGKGTFVFVPNWDDDADAFGVAHPQDRSRLVYICTYPDGFFVSLELAMDADAGIYHDLLEMEVIAVVREHLHIT